MVLVVLMILSDSYCVAVYVVDRYIRIQYSTLMNQLQTQCFVYVNNVNNITQHCNYKKERMNFEERFYFRRNRRRKGRNRRRKGRKRGRGLEGFDIEYYFLVIPMLY